jgi:hypothetical protein
MHGNQEINEEKKRQSRRKDSPRRGPPEVDPIEGTIVYRQYESLDLTIVDTVERVTGGGISMFPSRKRQLVRDLAFIEDRKPWQILEDALEYYVTTHYGTKFRRK